MSSLHSRMTLKPFSCPTLPRLESLTQANSNKTSLPGQLCFPFPCFGGLFSGLAVAPRQPVCPPWLKTPWKISWTCSCGMMVAVSQAIPATALKPETGDLSLASSSVSNSWRAWCGEVLIWDSASYKSSWSDGGGHSGTSSSLRGLCDAIEASYSKSRPGGSFSSSNLSNSSLGALGSGPEVLEPKASSCRETHSGVWFGVKARQARQPGVAPSFWILPKVIYTRLDFSFISGESSTNGIGSGDWGSRSTIEGSEKRSRALSATSASGKTTLSRV